MSSWLIKLDGVEFSSDDFLIEDVGSIETAGGTSWYIANPLVEIPVARAFLAAALLRSGRSEADVETVLKATRLGELRRAFTFIPDDRDGGEAEEPDPSDPPPSRTTPSSSPGEPDPTTGPQVSPEPNGSATSS